jgi:S1-C subfamily serine protease
MTKRSSSNPLNDTKKSAPSLGAARGQHGHGRDKLARSKRRQQRKHHRNNNNNNDDDDDDDDDDSGNGNAPALDLSLSSLTLADDNWRVSVARQHGAAVVKVIAHLVAFDWQMPFKSADSATSLGTGWFIDVASVSTNERVRAMAAEPGAAFVVTNAHVVDSAVKLWITVPQSGERRIDATVCGVCFDIDLAVLYVKDKELRIAHPLKLGDSNAVEIGESVVALGHPLGSQTLKLTEGVVSGRDAGLLSTTSPLNPGNSGGPLVNKSGCVIGVNVAIVENSQNIGFAIPSYHLSSLFDSLALRPKDARILFKPTLGCAVVNSSPALLAFSGVAGDGASGVLITEVLQDFPMHNAGIREGDIMAAFDGHAIDSYGDCAVPWHSERAPLDTVVGLLTDQSTPSVVFFRDGKRHETRLSFASAKKPAYPIMPAIRTHYPPFETPDFEVFFGLVLMPLTQNHVELFHEEANATVLRSLTPIVTDPALSNTPRIVISAILGGSDVSRADVLEPANVISRINGQPVNTLADLRTAFLQPVARNGGLFVTIETTDHKLVVLGVREAIDAERELSDLYRYNVSPLIRRLLRRESVLELAFGGDKGALQDVKKALFDHDDDGSAELKSPVRSPRRAK